MTAQSLMLSPHKNFEDIKKTDENGIEYWEARELMPLLEYDKWSNFDSVVIAKAKVACINSGQNITNHFADIGKMVKIGSGSEREKNRNYSPNPLNSPKQYHSERVRPLRWTCQ